MLLDETEGRREIGRNREEENAERRERERTEETGKTREVNEEM